MKRSHQGLAQFKRDLKAMCKKHNFKLKLVNKPTLPYSGNENIQVSGYFDSMNNELAVATKKPVMEWVEILIHESCHFDQYIEDSKIWNSNDYNGIDASSILDLWLNKTVELKPRVLDDMVKKIIILERDCDIRAIKKIKEYGLESIIDIDRYTQKSNAYHLSYIAVKKLRKWNKPKKSAYQVDDVLNSFPIKMSTGFSITDKQFKLLKKHCY